MNLFLSVVSQVIASSSGGLPFIPLGAGGIIGSGFGLIGMGLTDLLFGSDDDTNFADGPSDDEDPLFGEGGSSDDDELGDLDGLDPGFDDLVDENDDESHAASLEPRIEELENEIDSVSSTVSTVRSENQEIAKSVQDIEENIRKLLEIYEMVTRGVNPFVDEVQQASGFENDTFNLFDRDDTAGENEVGESDTDDDIARAAAETFFDGDVDEENQEKLDERSDIDSIDLFEEGASETRTDAQNNNGGLTFEELKQEYESGEADWADDQPGQSADDEIVEQVDETEPAQITDDAHEMEDPDGREDGHRQADKIENENERHDPTVQDASPEEDSRAIESTPREPTESTEQAASVTESDSANKNTGVTSERSVQNGNERKPYLEELPAGFDVELVVMEWLEFLAKNSDIRTAFDAIDYYENMEWISGEVATDLSTALSGIASTDGAQSESKVAARTDGAGVPGLTIEHHRKSLQYISRLTGGQFQPGTFQMGASGGSNDGV